MNFEFARLLEFWRERIVKNDAHEREKSSLGSLLVDNEPEIICMSRSERKVELRLVGEIILDHKARRGLKA